MEPFYASPGRTVLPRLSQNSRSPMTVGAESRRLLQAGEGFEYYYGPAATVAWVVGLLFVCRAVGAPTGLTVVCVAVGAVASIVRVLLTARVEVRFEDGSTVVAQYLSTKRYPGLPTHVGAVWCGPGNQALVVSLRFADGQEVLVRGIHLEYRRGHFKRAPATRLFGRGQRVVNRTRERIEALGEEGRSSDGP